MNSHNIPRGNFIFSQNVASYLVNWSQGPTVSVLGRLLLLLVVILTMAGGLFFWVSELSHALIRHGDDQSELELSRSGLQTMKRMVGDQQAWSESIQEEYNRLFVDRLNNLQAQPIDNNYGNNFTGSFSGSNYSINQVTTK